MGLLLVWAVHDGGYDADTWYWGALVLLAVLGIAVISLGAQLTLSRPAKRALACFAAYVAWSYLSIAWASSKGDALQGSNRTLLYLIVFALFVVLPWTAKGALVALLTFTLGVGTIAIVFLFRLASADHLANLVIDRRLTAPTGYFNSSVALFMTGALLATVLSTRREIPPLVRGLLIAIACACLQLTVVGQSRGWLFTLPLVLIATAVLVRNRFRVLAAAAIAAVATLLPIHRLLAIFQSSTPAALNRTGERAGQAALLACAVAFVLGTIIAWGESRASVPPISASGRQRVGAVLVALIISLGVVGGFVATHGDPIGFVKRQWNGFSQPETGGVSSHFLTVGSGRYDFWRVALDATLANPVGGLGQDNFADYYVSRRRSSEEPAWPHSLEMSLLASTGLVGFGLFAAFLVFALIGAARGVRSQDEFCAAVSAAALLPLVDWLLHGSVDWFWQIPALSATALGFLGMAVALSRPTPAGSTDAAVADARGSGRRRRSLRRRDQLVIGGIALVAATAALGFPYLSVREVSTASNLAASNPDAALSDLALAAQLNPLSAVPGRLGGTIALDNGLYDEATQRYQQAIDREPGGWLAWFGKGLAASALGDNLTASQALRVAISINDQQPAIKLALARVNTSHPLDPAKALDLIVLDH